MATHRLRRPGEAREFNHLHPTQLCDWRVLLAFGAHFASRGNRVSAGSLVEGIDPQGLIWKSVRFGLLPP